MRVFINYMNGKQDVLEDIVDFLQYPDHVVFKKKRNVSRKKFVMIEKKRVKSIKISMKD